MKSILIKSTEEWNDNEMKSVEEIGVNTLEHKTVQNLKKQGKIVQILQRRRVHVQHRF